jgi:2,3-bisphosphoglycerate-independent phosphoglycerate mutase
MTYKPTVLCILDGWGESDTLEHNAIAQANTPNMDRLRTTYPHSRLSASEGDVGLPEGQMGNSEVGHMNIGAGRVVMQDLPRIDAAIADGSLAKNETLDSTLKTLLNSGGSCHLMGLVSDGGVHAHVNHIAALARIVAARGVPVIIHAFLDGRDTPPKSALGYLKQLQDGIAGGGCITIGTVSGRYYAMDRDKRWDRVQKAYEALADAQGNRAPDALSAINDAYNANTTDEFVLPTVIGNYSGMKDGDGLLMANFRADRARELLEALVLVDFLGFERKKLLRFPAKLGMVAYSDVLSPNVASLFPPATLANNLGELLAAHKKTQLRIAETEKYAHVTFFFSGGREEPYAGEERILVPSPKVATYDLQPEMSAPIVAEKLVEAVRSNRFDFVVVNFANTDMVGHTGDMNAEKKAVEAVDDAVGKLAAAVEEMGGALLITADHGNAECLHDDDTQQAHTAHTLNLVPCILAGPTFVGKQGLLRDGVLADIAPTLCQLLGIPQPAEMTGRNLLTGAVPQHAVA